ncbi:MAG: glycosyl transferase [Xanthobacteraceae bacterium]|nr:glycosyl transferase [Xanthobacteraceae bacterium]
MRITITGIGTRGDVQPLVALAKELAARGHSVKLASSAGFVALSEGHGFEFVPLSGDVVAEMKNVVGGDFAANGRNPFGATSVFRDIIDRNIVDWTRTMRAAAADSDIIVTSGTAVFFGLGLARALHVPLVQVYLQPVLPNSDVGNPLFPQFSRRLPAFLHHAQYAVAAQLLWQALRPAVARSEHELSGASSVPLLAPFKELRRADRTILLAYSRHVVPESRHETNVVTTGFWTLKAAPGWTPPPDLARFLETGPPPIYVGFGSMPLPEPEKVARSVLAAVRSLGARAILNAGWSAMDPSDLRDDAILVNNVPHDWLFEHVAAVVHAGGAGTTAAALRAGRPSVVVPFVLDQFFWAERLHALRAAPPPLPGSELGERRLAAALRQATGNAEIVENARRLRQLVRSEGGVALAADRIERVHSMAAQPAGVVASVS